MNQTYEADAQQRGHFGGLTLRKNDSSSSLDMEDIDTTSSSNVFSTIDLNSANNTTNNLTSNHINDSIGYTSFGESSIGEPPADSVSHTNHTSSKSNDGTSSTHAAASTTAMNGSCAESASNVPIISLFNELKLGNSSAVLSSAGEMSTKFAQKTVTTIETLRQWSKSAYKCTRQLVSEKLGKTDRTVDTELDASIENLREVKKKYLQILELSQTMSTHLFHFIQTQKVMADSFAEMAQKSPELFAEFRLNSETQQLLFKHGQTLLNQVRMFTSSLSTLCNKTIEDTLLTVRNYEAARLEYDANRHDFELFKQQHNNLLKQNANQQQQQQQSSTNNRPSDVQKNLNQLSAMENELRAFKEKYEQLKKDVAVKMKFLDENRIQVMKKQLAQFQSAITAYFTNNQSSLEFTLNEMNKQQPERATKVQNKFQSFLEEN